MNEPQSRFRHDGEEKNPSPCPESNSDRSAVRNQGKILLNYSIRYKNYSVK